MGATACREVPVLDNHSESDDDPESFSGNHLGLNIMSMPQSRFVYWKGSESCELLEYIPALWPSRRNCLFRKANPSLRRGRGQHRASRVQPCG
jgi:hypothetical protein